MNPSDLSDPRFYAAKPCAATLTSPPVAQKSTAPTITLAPAKVVVCGRHWVTKNEAGEKVCVYCGAQRANAQPFVTDDEAKAVLENVAKR